MTDNEIIKFLQSKQIPQCGDKEYTADEEYEAYQRAIDALDQQPSDTVSRGAFEQVMWERDVAIGQLRELGYGLGQKIEPCDGAVSRKAVDELSRALVHTTRDKADFLCNFWEGLQKLPPVTQKSTECDDAISHVGRLIDLANAIESDDSGYWTNKRISSALRNISSVTQRTNCQYRHENGNCLKVGGFCTSVDDKHCPSVTQKSGKWIVHPEIETSTSDYLMFYECSECGDKQCFCKSDIHKKRFCSNCGAKMQESKETGEIHCNHTDTEIAKSFIEDVEAVKELLPKAGK